MIKKFTFWVFLFWVGITLQSCSVNTETTYHKDAATSMMLNVDMKEMLSFSKLMGDNSQNSGNQITKDFSNYPKEWKSLFDIKKEDATKNNKKMTTDKDSVRIMKKIFVKSNFDGNEFSGFGLKLDHLTSPEIEKFLKKAVDKRFKLPAMDESYKSWNGKTLTIDTDKFSFEQPKETAINKNKATDSVSVQIEKTLGEMKTLMKMFNFKVNQTLKFDSKIKSIEGKHDFVRQIDDKTVQININSAQLTDENYKLANKDKKIIIITE